MNQIEHKQRVLRSVVITTEEIKKDLERSRHAMEVNKEVVDNT